MLFEIRFVSEIFVFANEDDVNSQPATDSSGIVWGPQNNPTRYPCPSCGRTYKYLSTLKCHQRDECGKAPQYFCPFCPYMSKVKSNMNKHLRKRHGVNDIESCQATSEQAYNVRHNYQV